MTQDVSRRDFIQTTAAATVGLGGNRRAEFRMDIWNLPNTLHLNNPNATYLGSTFGRISGGYNERQMRFSARFIF